MTEVFTDHALEKECHSIAKEILEEYQEVFGDEDHIEAFDHWFTDRIGETVDGHEYVIYHWKALKFCADADTSDGEEFLSDVGMPQEPTLFNIASTIIYGEMIARVTSNIHELVEDFNEALDDAA